MCFRLIFIFIECDLTKSQIILCIRCATATHTFNVAYGFYYLSLCQTASVGHRVMIIEKIWICFITIHLIRNDFFLGANSFAKLRPHNSQILKPSCQETDNRNPVRCWKCGGCSRPYTEKTLNRKCDYEDQRKERLLLIPDSLLATSVTTQMTTLPALHLSFCSHPRVATPMTEVTCWSRVLQSLSN